MNERIRYRYFWKGKWVLWGFMREGVFLWPQPASESFQSTGLRDSTRTKECPEGKEIWEGSIIEGPSGKRATVEWNDDYGQWWSVPIDTTPNCPLYEEDCTKSITVIGDTTTTPELMEVRK